MNISKAARQALIPLEREIKSMPIECGYQLDNKVNVFPKLIGTESAITGIPFVKDALVLTHNHPNKTKNTLKLSCADLLAGINFSYREVRAISEDGYVSLVEIPKLGLKVLYDCEKIILKYDPFFKEINETIKKLNKKNIDKKLELNQQKDTIHKKMKKELEKVGGLKFRTIKLPESKV